MKPLIAASIAILMLLFVRGSEGQNERKTLISITVTLETATAKAGEAVSVRTVLTNNSKQPFDASGCYCGPAGLDSLFTWEVRDNGQLTAKRAYPHPELATGKIILNRVVKPGDQLSGSQDISRLYDMRKPGEYTIQASREIPKEMGGGVVKSNIISVTVAP